MLDISTLNEAQYNAVTAKEQSILVIAGAGSGKTRTLVYRLAWLIEQGLPVHNMLLLTFTRKASQEMLDRASLLLGQNLKSMNSGTFHSFAFSALRRVPEFCLRHAQNTQGHINLLDSSDQSSVLKTCREDLKIAKGDKLFPKAPALISMISKSRNKELELDHLLQKENCHLLTFADDIHSLANAYSDYKKKHGLYDYDDLLFELESLLREEPSVLNYYLNNLKHIMVDEYQDTNKVQARLIKLLAGESGSVMAVGDDAQSIYAFRGATVRNILEFPKHFKDTRILYLEENYRSEQPILDIANCVLAEAKEGYNKNLFTSKSFDIHMPNPVRVYKAMSDISQARLALSRIQEHLLTSKPSEIAVLFRSGFHAFRLENELNERRIPYKKYGGIKVTEKAEVKDLLAYLRLILNPLDYPAFERIASFAKGIGKKTAQKLFNASQDTQSEQAKAAFEKLLQKYPDFLIDMQLLEKLKKEYEETKLSDTQNPRALLSQVLERHKEHMPELYPEDYPKRIQALEEFLSISGSYNELDLFVANLVLNSTEEEVEDDNCLILSTIHSAKGLEWDNVLIMDLVEERFPSKHALVSEEEFEEERRLMYVACTRARKNLDLFVPNALYSKIHNGYESALTSPFIRSIDPEKYLLYQEVEHGQVFQKRQYTNYRDPLEEKNRLEAALFQKQSSQIGNKSLKEDFLQKKINENNENQPTQEHIAKYKKYGYCKHKVFGRGKIIEEIDNEKYRINFPNIGLKVILKNYVTLED